MAIEISHITSTVSIPGMIPDNGDSRKCSSSTKASVFRGMSLTPATSRLVNHVNKISIACDWRFISSAIIPLMAVLCLGMISLMSSVTSYTTENELFEKTKVGRTMGHLIHAIQVERGLSCAFLESQNASKSEDVFNILNQNRQNTNKISDMVQWSLLTSIQNRSAKRWFRETVDEQRTKINIGDIRCKDALQFYTFVNQNFLTQMTTIYDSTSDGDYWNSMTAYHALVLVKDNIGIKRALGAKYFATGYFTKEERLVFIKLAGAIENGLTFVFNKSPTIEAKYGKMMKNGSQMYHWLRQYSNSMMITNETSPDIQNGLNWFDNMTIYLNDMRNIETWLAKGILSKMDERIQGARIGLVITALIACLVLLISPPITIWYSMRAKKMMNKINSYIERMKMQASELKAAQLRSDALLYQMLPKSIAETLKQRKVVEPEYFESVTLFFSDVVGFTSLAAKSTPFQVCQFLNQLYSTFDEVIDRYSVYKVETIGDSYMVVSGLPNRNGQMHAAEIATMSLELLMSLDGFTVTHLGSDQLLIRIGAHSGPCAAGVVGRKMPRYCLFGDTINTASRLESSGGANKIQISESMNNLLHKCLPHTFVTSVRDTISVKGKDSMQTSWLIERRGFPFKVDLKEADRQLDNTTYWRDNYDAPKNLPSGP